ncbi:MAG: nucleotide exchange factor GrpE [Clostridia bacterium]|nr:nucleotide exchange factor GrpE [Clostridia bacterium]
MAEIEKNLEEKEEEVQEEVTVESLLKETEKLKQENEKYYEHLQRTAAEFDNYKKRMQKEKEATYNLAVGDVVTKYIDVLDNLEKALLAETTDEKMKEGIGLIKKEVVDIMTSLKVERIQTDKQTFNPEYHEAVMHIEDEKYGEQEIVEEFRSGYKMGTRVLRHAMVKVAN